MELQIQKYSLPEAIRFNFEELKTELQNRTEQYKVAIYSDDQIQDAKKDKATLNRLDKALNDERIRLQKEYMQPFEEFKNRIDELRSIIKEPVALIDSRVKDFEAAKKEAKRLEIVALWESINHEPEQTLEHVWSDKWLNASVSLPSIQSEMKSKAYSFRDDMTILKNLKEFSEDAQIVYIQTGSLALAMEEVNRLGKIAAMRAERAKAAQKETESVEQNATDTSETPQNVRERVFSDVMAQFTTPEEKRAEMRKISFSVVVTKEQAQELSAYMHKNGIRFTVISTERPE